MKNKSIFLIFTIWMSLIIEITTFDDIKTPYSPLRATAMFVLGDFSVDCGDNTLFYSLIRHKLSVFPCPASHDHDATLLPQLIAEKLGLPNIDPFYTQNGSLDGVLSGINFGSALATIMSASGPSHQSLNQQLRQTLDTLQLLHLLVGEENAKSFIRSSIFYLSFGANDYINRFLDKSPKYDTQTFARILVNQMLNAVKDLYDANVRRIIYVGILPLGCTPRMLWERFNSTRGFYREKGGCVDEINGMVLDYNAMLEKGIFELNDELSDAQIVFCDVYRGIMEIFINPIAYGFEDIMSACCGEGRYGGESGCASMDMACDEMSTHVWWDLYNPTPTVNSIVAQSAWSGQPMPDICHPHPIRLILD